MIAHPEPPFVGIREGMDPTLYHAVQACSASRLNDLAQRSPAYAKWNVENAQAPTEAQLRGIAAHAAILEPESLESRFVVAGRCEAQTKNGRCNNTGSVFVDGGCYCRVRGHAPEGGRPETRQVVAPEVWDEVRSIRESVLDHPEASRLLVRAALRESSVFWVDHGLPCKARPDLWLGDEVADVKVTRNANPTDFARECANRGHHRRQAFYEDGIAAVRARPKRFLFIAVEPDAPHECCVYELHRDAVELGRDEYRASMARYAECVRSGEWPGYPRGVELLTLPPWYFTRDADVPLTSGGSALEF